MQFAKSPGGPMKFITSTFFLCVLAGTAQAQTIWKYWVQESTNKLILHFDPLPSGQVELTTNMLLIATAQMYTKGVYQGTFKCNILPGIAPVMLCQKGAGFEEPKLLEKLEKEFYSLSGIHLVKQSKPNTQKSARTARENFPRAVFFYDRASRKYIHSFYTASVRSSPTAKTLPISQKRF